ncbi:hypothetical protein VOLCADRAFT_120517 [Volvox carteri f. nagariensis]|uniref:Plastid lipid-associated protein/fibrillin conserved domain-containing protein n=1 Tax=Volvox carteri f. nagariensis TaxID=3068 RepID=D8TND2_VOLCA|nr:uncharacterized protein VOLCADRAFT_120517 [Volvox carteri f. nagariensis]EFJ50822.1 hypothetical protein VOLCADRAFT_120517 [Volvox carteri f. nagariensis]|eukprot:XP_002947834.1 hypothetical protein VOLCADRAFT_120517 [Volvox carteri f. nagariensis]
MTSLIPVKRHASCAINVSKRCNVLTVKAFSRFQDTECHLAETKKELNLLIQNLGFPSTVLPGDPRAKSEIDKVLHRLEALTPAPEPLLWQQQPGGTPGISPLLLGEWELLYASNGILVTRTAPAELLRLASRLPGVGLSDITQTLALNEADALVASNSAVLGFGPMGSWKVGIEGIWRDSGDGKTARVLFDQVSIKPVSAMGLAAPSWLPPLRLASGGSSGPGEVRAGASWTTTFVDRDTRVGRGRDGEAFLFRRKPPQ